jgi:hypothetical protein
MESVAAQVGERANHAQRLLQPAADGEKRSSELKRETKNRSEEEFFYA